MLSLVIGSITFRLRGPYFVLASISVAEIIRLAVLHFKDFTRGAEGFLLSDIPTLKIGATVIDFFTKVPFYYAGARPRGAHHRRRTGSCSTRSSATTSRRSARTRTRRTRSGINLDLLQERRPGDLGGLHRLGGRLLRDVREVHRSRTPCSASTSRCRFVLICIIGGIGTILGPVIGAMVLVPALRGAPQPEGLVQLGVLSPDSGFVRFVEANLANAHLLVYGILVVIVILFAPEGVLGVIRRTAARVRRRARRAAEPARRPDGATMAILEIKHVSKFFGGLAANSDVSFSMEQGMIMGLIGPNGAGKTTLFNCITGYYPPSKGEVLFKGTRLNGLQPDQVCQLGMVRTWQKVRPLAKIPCSTT